MSTQTFQMINLSVNDLTDIISNCVKAELQKVNDVIQLHPKTDSKELLTREETAKLLHVSYTSLYHWNKGGILKAKKISSRVFYLRSDVMDKLNNIA